MTPDIDPQQQQPAEQQTQPAPEQPSDVPESPTEGAQTVAGNAPLPTLKKRTSLSSEG